MRGIKLETYVAYCVTDELNCKPIKVSEMAAFTAEAVRDYLRSAGECQCDKEEHTKWLAQGCPVCTLEYFEEILEGSTSDTK